MDSGNSCSLQSSSGGDEEYDSRTDSISAFFNPSTTSTPSFSTLIPPPNPPPISHFIDTLSYLDSNPNPLLNLDLPWPPTFSSPYPVSLSTSLGPPPHQPDQPIDLPAAAPRSSKKRSRASRRAPTTVLTTDTSNFRAMVQEFTGIPAPPFAASASLSSPYPRSGRFDFLHAASSFRSNIMDTPTPYLLRPFAHKAHPPPFGSSSCPSSLTSINTTTNQTITDSSFDPPSSDLGLTFQSLLAGPKYSLPAMPAFAPARPQAALPGADLGLAAIMSRRDDLSGWSNGSGQAGGDRTQLSRPGGARNYGSAQEINCKVNYSAAAGSSGQVDKGCESVLPGKGEGTIESWICSSD